MKPGRQRNLNLRLSRLSSGGPCDRGNLCPRQTGPGGGTAGGGRLAGGVSGDRGLLLHLAAGGADGLVHGIAERRPILLEE